MRASVLLFAGTRIQDSWKELEYCVKTGEPAYRLRGATDPFDALLRDPEETANFDAAMADFTRLAAIAVAAAYDFSSLGSVRRRGRQRSAADRHPARACDAGGDGL